MSAGRILAERFPNRLEIPPPTHHARTPLGGAGGLSVTRTAQPKQQQQKKMPLAPSPQKKWPRGPRSKLHLAALNGSTESTRALLSGGSPDVNQQADLDGMTALMVAAHHGHSRIVKMLLSEGASASIADDLGFTALHSAAGQGYLAVMLMLLKAGADLDAANRRGLTPLHMATGEGHAAAVDVLIVSGAKVNSRDSIGMTPLYLAAQEGKLDALKVLLRAKADPLLTLAFHPVAPLTIAADKGHSGVIRELIHQLGIKGCGGDSSCVQALAGAARIPNMDIMGLLTDAGVVDTGEALFNAALQGREEAVKFLLQQREKQSRVERAAYVNARDPSSGQSALIGAIECAGYSSAKVVRLLIDAGADTTSAGRRTDAWGRVFPATSPLALTKMCLHYKKINGEDATEAQLESLEVIRRLLLRLEAVHAVSWVWHNEVPSIARAAAEGPSRTKLASARITAMLPILRQRARRPKVLLSTLFRWVVLSSCLAPVLSNFRSNVD